MNDQENFDLFGVFYDAGPIEYHDRNDVIKLGCVVLITLAIVIAEMVYLSTQIP